MVVPSLDALRFAAAVVTGFASVAMLLAAVGWTARVTPARRSVDTQA